MSVTQCAVVFVAVTMVSAGVITSPEEHDVRKKAKEFQMVFGW